MIRKIVLSHIWLTVFAMASAQQQPDFNLEAVSTMGIEYPDSIPSQYRMYNDVWGYDAPDGRAYAILGTGIGTAIFDVTEASSPVLVAHVPGAWSRWRDFKSFENYVYVVADAGDDGILIIDMSMAPDSVTYQHVRPEVTVREDVEGNVSRCHNLYIDGSYLYLSGCNIGVTNRTGVVIFDLSTDPLQPEFIASTGLAPVYSHDVFVQDGRLYSSDFFEGKVNIWDVTNPATPSILSGQETGPSGTRGTHNAWVSTDNRYLFTTDEESFGLVQSYDMLDLEAIEKLDDYVPSATRNLAVIPHNVHYYNGYLVTSFYSDGIKIIDAHRPENLVEVGSYDTYLERDGGFRGVWGAYPFTASGLVYGSDRSTGLWVLRPTYKRAAYVEGLVQNEAGDPLSGVQIALGGDRIQNAFTSADGRFALGSDQAGPNSVTINSDPSLFPLFNQVVVDTSLIEGEIIELTITLQGLPEKILTGRVVDDLTMEPIDGAEVKVLSDRQNVSVHTDSLGAFEISAIGDDYVIAAGAWGWQHVAYLRSQLETDTIPFYFLLKEGYRDDFEFDYGWQVDTGDFNRPIDEWSRGIPEGARYDGVFANPSQDLEDDFGGSAYVTGLTNGLGGNLAGISILRSPEFDGTTFTDPFINYSLWFFASGVLASDDSLKVYVGNGSEEVMVELLTESATGWRERSEIRLLDHIELSDAMYVRFHAGDVGDIHIYEAGVDGFSVTEGMTTSVEETNVSVTVKPNPVQDLLTIESEVPTQLEIYNLIGQLMGTSSEVLRTHQLDVEDWPSGIYWVLSKSPAAGRRTLKVLKH